MAITEYIDSIERANWAKHGERASVKDFGAVSDGVADCSAAFQMAYDSMVAKGGGSIDIPGVGTAGMSYKLNTPIEMDSDVPVSWYGQGYSSKITRGANLPAGKGLFNLVNAKHVLFRNFLVDGMVTASTGLLYSDFAGNPVNPTLTLNTSFWVQGGEDIEWDGVYIEHTGGYAAYLDAVKRARFLRCIHRNNRPHTMGTVAGDLNYGSPTGGIFYYNQGGGKADGLTVRGCTFERNTGRCVWGASASGSPHQQVQVENNKFSDFGLEAILLGHTVGGSVIGNSFRRGGYITGDDTSPGAPRAHPNFPAKAIATFGSTRLVPCSGNDCTSINGIAIFGDGYGYGVITGNSIRVPRSGDPEYAEDSIGSFASKARGIELRNSQGSAAGATGVSITGNTLDNLDGSAIGLYAARKCDARGNLIIMAAGASSPPIVIGGTAGSNQNATENLVTGNTIHYAPAAEAPAVFEDPAGRAFVPTDQNNVFNNYCRGVNVFEFQRDPISDSNAALFFTTATTATAQSRHGMQREGTGEGSALRWYAQDGDAFGWMHMQLQMYRAAGERNPLLNVSETGPGMENEGGCITTGNVTQLPFGNAMATSKLSASGFLAMGDATFWDVEANLLPSVDVAGSDGWALLRWDGSINKWQQSVTGGGAEGPRIWTDFGAGGTGGGVPGPPHESVQFNDNGEFGGDAYFSYAKVTHQLTLFSFAYNGITMPNGGLLAENVNVRKYVSFVPKASLSPAGADSFTGNALLYSDSSVDRLRLVRGVSFDTYEDYNLQLAHIYASGTASNTIQAPYGGVSALKADFTHNDRLTVYAPNGGITSKWLVANESLTFLKRSTADLSQPGEMRFYADVDGQLYVSTDGAPWGPFGSGLRPGGTDGDIQFNYGDGTFHGQPQLNWDYDLYQMKLITYPDRPGIRVLGGWIDSGMGFSTNTDSPNAVQAQSGGVHSKWLHANESLIFTQIWGGGPALSAAGETRLYANGDGQIYISTNTAPWGPLSGMFQAEPAGISGQVQYNKNGVFGADAFFTWDFNNKILAIEGYFQTNSVANQVQWVMYRKFAPETVYYVGVDSAQRYFVQAASFGPVLLYLHPSGDPNATMLSTPGTVQSLYVNAVGSSSASIQAASGGVTARWICPNESLIFLGIGEPARSSGTQVRMYASTSGVLYVSANGAAYGPLGVTPAAGQNGSVQYNNNGPFGGAGDFTWDYNNKILAIGGGSGYFQTNTSNPVHLYMHRPNYYIYWVGIDASSRWFVQDAMTGVVDLYITASATATSVVISTPGTFQGNLVNAVGASSTAIQAASGGIVGRWIIANESLILKQGGEPARASGGEVRIYANWNGVTYISTAGQAYGPLGGGIQSTTQPQWTATNSGYNYTFNNSNNYFVVDGNGTLTANGVITTNGGLVATPQVTNAIQSGGGFNAGYGGSANGVYMIAGGTVINNSRQFVGYGGVNTSGAIITTSNVSAASYQIAGGYYGVDVTGGIQVGAGAPTKTLYFKGGICYYAG